MLIFVPDFIYIRKNEIIESPYFTKFSNFTHDVDKFYRDITSNDAISNIYKYTKIVWTFLKEKYFKLVPFAGELTEIFTEIVNEIKELKKLPSISYLIEKYNEMEQKVKWFYDYFDIEVRLQRFITLVHRKLTDIKQTALQAENRFFTAEKAPRIIYSFFVFNLGTEKPKLNLFSNHLTE